jgi:hypothetical protein
MAIWKIGRPSLSRVAVEKETSPAVKLSPNARNFVRERRGIAAVTVTVKTHEVVCAAASVAVHWTVVAPTANGEPDWRVQLTWTGATPPVADAAANVTGTAAPVVDVAVAPRGHAMVKAGRGLSPDGPAPGGPLTGGVGLVGVEQPAASSVPRTTRARATKERIGG